MDRRRLALTVLFSLVLFGLLPLSIWVMNTFDFPWLFLAVFGLILVGYALLWPYRLVFLGLLILLSGAGLLYRGGDLLFSLLFFLVPYGAACVTIAYRLAERLTAVEWAEPQYIGGEAGEPGGLEEPAGPVLNPWALPRRERRTGGSSRRGERRDETGGEGEDPCGGDIIDLLLEKGADSPEAEEKLRRYMECRAREFIEHFDKFERSHGFRVGES